jgi:uncharacterized membrane protein
MENRLASWVRRVLVFGIIVSVSILLMGGALYLYKYGNDQVGTDYSVFHGEPKDLRGIPDIFVDLMQLHSQGIIQFGIFILIATPLARVAVSILAFIKDKDWTYVVVTGYVFLILLYSLVWRGLIR